MTALPLDEQNQAFADLLASSGGPPISALSPVNARAALESICKYEPAADISVQEIDVPVNGGDVSTLIVRPKAAKGPLTFVFYTHGGGWILGSPSTHGQLLEDLARQSGSAIVFPYYTPAPDAQYPVQFDQAFGVLEWILRNGAPLDLKTDRYVCAGDSVGGHMAIAMTYLANEKSLTVKPSALVLFYPVTTTSEQSAGYTEFENGPYLSKTTLEWMVREFLPSTSDRKLPINSPLNAMSDEDLAKFPPTLILPSGVDPLREEGELFGRRLQKLGVNAAVLRVNGQVHDWAIIQAIRFSPSSQAAISLAALKMKSALI